MISPGLVEAKVVLQEVLQELMIPLDEPMEMDLVLEKWTPDLVEQPVWVLEL